MVLLGRKLVMRRERHLVKWTRQVKGPYLYMEKCFEKKKIWLAIIILFVIGWVASTGLAIFIHIPSRFTTKQWFGTINP